MAVKELDRIIQGMHCGIVVHDADGIIILANQAAADALGLTIDQIHGRTSVDPRWHVIHEDGSPFPGETHPSVITLASGIPQSDVVMGVQRPDGTLSWLNVSSEPLFKDDGSTLDGVIVTFIDITGLRKSSQALLESESNYRALFDNLIDVYYQVDLNGLFTQISPSIQGLLGYRAEELHGRKTVELYVDPEQRARFVELLAQTEGGVSGYEAELRRKDGSRIWVSISARYRNDGDGAVCCVEGTIRDISEKKRIEQELFRSEQLHRTILDSAQVGVIFSDNNSRFLRVNPYLCQFLGYSEDELLQMGPADITYPEDMPDTSKIMQDIQQGGLVPAVVEKRYRCKDGSVRWGVATLVPMLNEEGGRCGSLVTIVDSDERKRTEQALRDSEELFRAFFHYAPFGAALSDRNGRIFQSNLALQQMFGLSEQELLSLHFRDYTLEEDVERNLALFAELLQGQRDSYQMEKRYRRKDGTIFWGNLAVSAIRDALGEVKTVFSMVEDISDRIEGQREQYRLQRQLQQAQKMEAIGQLTGGIAHDFNNILAAILGYAQLAIDYLLPPGNEKLAKALEEIRRGGQRAEHLVAQMLDFSRGRPLSPEPTSVALVLDEVIEMAGATLPSSIQIESHIADNVPNIMANPVQLHQVLLNLIINARDAMEGKGGLAIDVSYGEREGRCNSCHESYSGEHVEITIRDTAGTLTSEILARAFDPFFTTKAVGRGTGMGLSMVHGILHDWGGHVRVTLSPGEATLFHLLLPVSAVVPVIQSDGALAAQAKGGMTNAQHLSREAPHIMVVDDEVAIGRFLEELLKIHGYKVTLFSDSREAADSFRKAADSYDLLLTDQTMPQMTGVELIEEVHALRPELPVILSSGYSEQVNEGNAANFGISTYLAKPVESMKLFAAIERLLAAAGRRAVDE